MLTCTKNEMQRRKNAMWKIWDRKFGYYCLTLHTKEQAETMVRHFEKMDLYHKEAIDNRYRIDEVRV